jgi:two-component sensor histidine kinase
MLTWRVERAPAAETFHLEWQERGGPAVVPPAGRGFGTTLLEGAFPSGQAQLRFDPAGFSYVLDAPLEAIAERSA